MNIILIRNKKKKLKKIRRLNIIFLLLFFTRIENKSISFFKKKILVSFILKYLIFLIYLDKYYLENTKLYTKN